MTSGTKLFNVVDNLYNYNLDDFYKDIFDAFSFNEDVEYWYNKWANIRQ